MARSTQSASTSQKVEAFIRNAIYEGRLKPRERIIEDDIAQQLGCSRGPVREAVLRLERDGLIIITPRRGTFIRDISPDEVEVVFSVRSKLEALCVRYLREQMTQEKKDHLLKALADLRTAAAAGNQEQFLRADMRLHRTIWRLSGKQQLYRTLRFAMNPMVFMVASTYSSKVHSLKQSFESHEEYVKTILNAPLPRVEREVEKYFKSLYRELDTAVFHRAAPPLNPVDDMPGDDDFDSEEIAARPGR